MRQGTIGRQAGVYNFGAALNITQNWLGFNVRTRKVLNDFGVIRWYQYLVQFVVFELNRIIRAINVPRPAFFRPVTTASPRAGDGGLGGNGTAAEGLAAAYGGDSVYGGDAYYGGDGGAGDVYGDIADVPNELVGGFDGATGLDAELQDAAAEGEDGGAGAAQQPVLQATFSPGGLLPGASVLAMQRPSVALYAAGGAGTGGQQAAAGSSRRRRDASGAEQTQIPFRAGGQQRASTGVLSGGDVSQLLGAAAAGQQVQQDRAGTGSGAGLGTIVSGGSSEQGSTELLRGLDNLQRGGAGRG